MHEVDPAKPRQQALPHDPHNAIPGKELKSIVPQGDERRERTPQSLEGAMRIQEKISGPETLLKLYVTIDDDLNALPPHLQRRHGLHTKTHGKQCAHQQEDTEERPPIAV
jgi:hypothetical protein